MADEEKRRAALERVRRMVERHARSHGLALQSDRGQLQYVLDGLVANLLERGRTYCPCRALTGDPERDGENICPCRHHHREIEQSGECECSLFLRGPGSLKDKE